MKMFKRVALAATVAAVPLGFLAASGSAYAVTKPVKFTGSISCGITGAITATPGLSNTSQTVKLSLKATMKSCTGSTSEGGETLTGGTATAVQTLTGATCGSLVNGLPAGSLTVKYTASPSTPGIMASKVAFSGVGATVTGSNLVITLIIPKSGGTTTTTGSFANATSASKASAVVDQLGGALLTQCGKPGGVKKIAFTGVNGPSTATVG